MFRQTSRITRRAYSQKVSPFQSRKLQYLDHTLDSTHVTTLKNGVQVVSRDHLGGLSQLSVRVNVGSRDESYDNNGVSHFVQRFFFGPTVNRTFVNLTSIFQNIGAEVSAQHGREEIVYSSTQLRDAVPTALELMSDSIVYARLHEWDMGSKKRLVEDDIEQFDQHPDLVLDQMLHTAAFGNRGLGRSLACPAYNLNKINIQQVRDFMDTHYVGPNMRIVGSNVEHEALVSLAEKLFEDVPLVKGVEREASVYVGGNSQVNESAFVEGEPNVLSALAWKGYARGTGNYYTSLVLKQLMGSSFRSTVGPNNTLAGGEGLVSLNALSAEPDLTKAETFSYAYSDAGLFGVKLTGRTDSSVTTGLYITLHILETLASKSVSKAGLELAQRRAAIEIVQGTSSLLAGHEFMLQEAQASEVDEATRLFNVTAEDVSRLAKELLNSKQTLVTYGAVGNVPYVL